MFCMKLKIFILLSVIFIASVKLLNAQFYLTGQDAAAIKWKQIKTQNFKIIFPENYFDKALEYANYLEFSQSAVNDNYKAKTRKFKIVLHTGTTTSNAMVSPTPFHADFFEMPEQNTYSQKWSKQLTLHEYRHGIQMMKMRQGFTGALYYLIGDQATAIMMGAFLPFWFIEGDAVYSETQYSNSGRGRSPEFSMDIKAQLVEKGIYKYDKAQFGSLKHYTPDHYTLGYQIVLNGINKYGSQIWDEALNRTAKTPFMLVPFTSAIKKYHGKGKVDFYNSSLEQIKKQWESEDKNKQSYFLFDEKTDDFTNYRFPIHLNDGSFICLKQGIDDIDRFVKVLPNGSEEVLYTPGFVFGNSLSANDSLICWNEKEYHIRWSLKDFSVIKIYNFKTKKLTKIDKNTRYFSPDLSHNARFISAVENDETGKSSLLIINPLNGEIITKTSPEDDLFIITPKWSGNDKSIVYIALGDKGKAIFKYDISKNEHIRLSEFTFDDIKYPSLSGNTLVFSAPYGQTNNIYSINLKNNKLYKQTNTRFNVSDLRVSPSADSIYFAEYTADGYRISAVKAETNQNNEYVVEEKDRSFPIDELNSNSTFNLDEEDVENTNYEVKKYSKLGNSFNLHSWGPTVIDAQNFSFNPGINLLSQNLLSTSVATAGYYYETDDERFKFKFGYDYLGLWPVISLGAELYDKTDDYYTDKNGMSKLLSYRENIYRLGVSIPLNFTNSKWIQGIRPYINLEYRKLKVLPTSELNLKVTEFNNMSYRLYAYNQLKRSERDIFPKWGQTIDLNFRNTINLDENTYQFGAAAYFYIPGFVKHHGFRVYAAYQDKAGQFNTFGSLVSKARGYTGVEMDNYFSLKADYAFPIFYPDFDIPSIAYLKNVYAHIYYDYNYDYGNLTDYNSTGLELYTQWHFLGTAAVFTLGGRYTYRINSNNNNFEFLIGIGY